MSTSFFFLQADKNAQNSVLLDKLEHYANKTKKQIYVLDKPLGDSKYIYSYKGAFLLLIPNHSMIFVNIKGEDERFRDYIEDFIEDLGSISDKFRYKEVIGRPRSWRNELFVAMNLEDFGEDISKVLDENILSTGKLKKTCELLISLLTGSINDINKVKGNVPDNILDKVKQKILLFDGDQTRFVYQKPANKRVTIQGLSGTGKTELLLHKLKEVYVANADSKIAFTCHNKILADSLRGRIPDFFNFMKVEEQIKWNERLWCVNAWGSQNNKNSGIYSFVCTFYNIVFLRWSPLISFDFVCQKAIEEIKKLDNNEYAFDFMLIDESQDFPASFFDLCELVTENTIYVAGDIFQSIFDDKVVSEIQPDFLLSKCYRTDPKTLMFSHALGMGLFESPKLRWLEDNEWNACGYLIDKSQDGSEYKLTREPLRRFEDLEQEGFKSVELVKTSVELGEDAELKVLEIIRSICDENPTVLADDIGVIFIDSSKNTYLSADRLEASIPREFGWKVNKAYESKEKIKDTLFVSNKNNVKGLEFPFVICITKKLSTNRSYRNALYMMLTRSFIKTYLLISQDSNGELANKIEVGLNLLNETGELRVSCPSDEEKLEIVTAINYTEENISFYDFVERIFTDLDVLPLFRELLFETVKNTVGESFEYDKVREVAEFNYSRMDKGV
ncbi:DEAD/DEAH box helicase [Marinobacter psychrophilus]|uniref:DEAD/DEAH box helicase n=1 Tax=Marinobacter psychrophilus TaxID=330734 RepID=UPI001B724F40|nr:ATP-binding domain-containing protein [Marinobacter psychrophilus]MBQ0762227.1 DEAD/DEAH box helicase [Marinobacter psychrophilus]MBQ0844589.1 DEAD/DEAH box helicase [Marinobacter psychrophilus]